MEWDGESVIRGSKVNFFFFLCLIWSCVFISYGVGTGNSDVFMRGLSRFFVSCFSLLIVLLVSTGVSVVVLSL